MREDDESDFEVYDDPPELADEIELPPEIRRLVEARHWQSSDDELAEALDRYRLGYRGDVIEEMVRQASRQHAKRLIRGGDIDLANLPPALSLTERLAQDRPRPRMLVEDLFRYGHNIIFVGESGTGKTHTRNELARALVTGEPFLDRFEVDFEDDAKVLILNYEMDEYEHDDWLARLDLDEEHRKRIATINLRGVSAPLDHEAVQGWLTEQVAHLGEVGLLIIDPYEAAFRIGDGGNVFVRQLLEGLNQLKARMGIPNLLIIDHTGHLEKHRPRDESSKINWTDGLWWQEGIEHKPRYFGTRAVRSATRDIYKTRLRLDPSTHRVTAVGSAEARDPEPMTEADRALMLLAEAGGEATGAEGLREALRGIRTQRQKPAIDEAKQLGLIERVGTRPYVTRLTEEGWEYAEARGWMGGEA